jgi:hypothetical protein
MTEMTGPKALTPEGSQYRLPSRPTLLEITPEMASDWLSYRMFDRNRRPSKTRVERLMDDIEAGRWRETHQGIAFDTEGYQIDGRHRLTAVANGTATVRMWVFPNQSRETFDVIDTGYGRTAAQFLPSVAPSMAAGAARYISAAIDSDFPGVYRSRLTLHQVLELHREWPEIETWALAVYGARAVASIPPSPLLAIVAMGERGGVDPRVIQDFLDGLKSGAIGDSRDPRLLVRNRFIRDQKLLGGGRNRVHAYALLVKSFNAFAKDERPARLIYTEGDHIPLPLGLTWGGRRLDTPGSAAA